MINLVIKFRLYIAWFISLFSTVISLSFSKIFGFIPCELCWYQRILMYPLVFIIFITIYKENQNEKSYILPFSILGLFISFYHVLIQKIPTLSNIMPCTESVPCNVDYLNWFGFITIPLLAFIAFLLITILTCLKTNNK
ncbi:disulfide oxidoreductase [Bacillus cereus]|uniref:disulfide oxidoreductase n=1 Tax=Bacillus cereus TaxID=1396 RepID=UPI000BEC7A27|nr:disulfide oxidoreductase [Bacillus cereus]PEC90974.1 disulfide bond formation protein B [Bacillus cereus]PFO47211.1 disulfide bond formation protein B [Bacillus cereus]PFQ97188.1 disulfide bond formation protein B [Bacillus cereus]PFV19406.1 disulfide bond formation protein B [Bacillus cereus]